MSACSENVLVSSALHIDIVLVDCNSILMLSEDYMVLLQHHSQTEASISTCASELLVAARSQLHSCY